MFKNESRCDFKKLNKYLNKIEFIFLHRLYYWSSHKNGYGIEHDGRVWIYNTLEDWAEQIGVSKRSIQRSVQSLKSQGFISAECLSKNKRNRTLFYSINYDAINIFLCEKNSLKAANNKKQNVTINGHMLGHMYITENIKQDINKSYKSGNKNLEEHISDSLKIKPTTVQDMITVWNEEFSDSKIELNKNLARFMVAAFKAKFKSCIKEWGRYLKALKTSAFIMGEKFKLSIWWVIKFITIDRIRAGEFGVNMDKIPVDETEIAQKAINHINNVQETDVCKQIRKRIVSVFSPQTYVSWFMNIDFVEENKKIIAKTSSDFVRDYIMNNFAHSIDMEFA